MVLNTLRGDCLFTPFLQIQLRFIVTGMPPKCGSKRKCAESHSDHQTRATAMAVSSNTRVNNNSDSAVPLTRNDIPAIVQEVARQLRPEGANAFTPLMPSMFYHLFTFFVCVL